MLSGPSGCITRRFFALDGLFDTFLTVLKQMEVFPAVIEAEKTATFPFLSTQL